MGLLVLASSACLLAHASQTAQTDATSQQYVRILVLASSTARAKMALLAMALLTAPG
jgi:hypothetical protein